MLIVTVTRCDLRDEFAMAAVDEVFALSPISARATLPSEADYDAIREAFMETARGRWFLGEYAKRNRNADTSMVLDAVARIEATMAAQKQPPPPSNELPNALVLIRGMLSDAKDSAAKTMSGPDAEQALAAVNKATRIIREIAWTLREYGTDARICDMLDAQVNAIEASHFQTIAPEKRESVLAAFDLLIRRVGELGGSGGAPTSFAFESAPSESADRGTPTSEATAAPTETVSQAETPTAAEAAAAARPEVVAATMPGEPAQDVLAQEALEQDALEQDLAPQGFAQQDPAQQVSTPQDLAQHQADAQHAPGQSREAAAATMTTSADAALTELPGADGIAAADEDAAERDLEAEHDMALLDAIALEMAEPLEPPELAGPDLAEAPPTLESDIFGPVPSGPVAAESPVVESATIEPIIAEPAAVEPMAAEPAITEPEISEPAIVEPAPETAMVPEPEPVAPPQPSLGASLLASGIVSTNAGHDALAPIRRMSQAEKIAFFS